MKSGLNLLHSIIKLFPGAYWHREWAVTNHCSPPKLFCFLPQPSWSFTDHFCSGAVACSLNFAESSMAQSNPHSWTLLPCKSGRPWPSWASGSGPGPYWAWQSTQRQEQVMLSQARACAHALALISLLVEPLNAMPLPEPCCCSSFLPFSEFVHCYFE